jgi:hypothetical protein
MINNIINYKQLFMSNFLILTNMHLTPNNERGLALVLSGIFKSASENFDGSRALIDTSRGTITLRAIAAFAVGEFKKADIGMQDALDRTYPYYFGYLWAHTAARLAQ